MIIVNIINIMIIISSSSIASIITTSTINITAISIIDIVFTDPWRTHWHRTGKLRVRPLSTEGAVGKARFITVMTVWL